jgi:hypothetical protein
MIVCASSKKGEKMKYVMLTCMIAMLLFAGSPKEEAAAFDQSFAAFKNEYAGKSYFAAYEKLHSTMELFWEKTPLLLSNVRYVMGEDNTYGIYEPRVDNRFAAGEPIYLYLEPIGFAFMKNTAGYYDFGFKVDFTLEDEAGSVLGGQKDFASPNFKSWNHNTEVSLTFTYTFTGFGKGKYKVITNVRDAYSGKSATVEKWFYIE